ncbi:hypothetical protein CC78DRAFT_612688 [Lojkania enalia]|uniref:BZIP domain-containing protein n=1 Tax=Lojkania enalia TaxID=147567 RepID=A0A9P4N9S0_9PLEO|nr:hypothetical protein CC78DRAFT_612688 [Didymosphaeria enalia]
MSGYNGRRGPNVSQYIANLNTISPQNDHPLSEPHDLDAELSLIMNSDFIDWNAGDGADAGTSDFDLNPSTLDLNFPIEQSAGTRTRSNSAGRSAGQPKINDFTLGGGEFQFADFSHFQDPIVNQSMQNLPQPQTNTYPIAQTYTSSVSNSLSPVAQHFDPSKKRKLDHIDPNSQQAIDEAARIAAEEDKRRRNTAASARFRVKKKQREQALEKTAKEMTERVGVLEARIQQLETENIWLKGLITEKNGGKATASEISALLKKHVEENTGERSTGNRTDGVGTETKDVKA